MKSPQQCQTLAEVRSEIDRLDRAIVRTISQRRQYVHAASRFKRSADEVHAQERQRLMLAARRSWAQEEGVDPDLIQALFRQIVDHFVAAELAIVTDREGSTGGRSTSPTTRAAAGECRDEADAC